MRYWSAFGAGSHQRPGQTSTPVLQREDARRAREAGPKRRQKTARQLAAAPRTVTSPTASADRLPLLMAPSHGAAAASPPCKQLVVSPDAMKNHRLAPNAIDKQEVVTQVTFRQSGPVRVALVETVFPKRLR